MHALQAESLMQFGGYAITMQNDLEAIHAKGRALYDGFFADTKAMEMFIREDVPPLSQEIEELRERDKKHNLDNAEIVRICNGMKEQIEQLRATLTAASEVIARQTAANTELAARQAALTDYASRLREEAFGRAATVDAIQPPIVARVYGLTRTFDDFDEAYKWLNKEFDKVFPLVPPLPTPPVAVDATTPQEQA